LVDAAKLPTLPILLFSCPPRVRMDWPASHASESEEAGSFARPPLRRVVQLQVERALWDLDPLALAEGVEDLVHGPLVLGKLRLRRVVGNLRQRQREAVDVHHPRGPPDRPEVAVPDALPGVAAPHLDRVQALAVHEDELADRQRLVAVPDVEEWVVRDGVEAVVLRVNVVEPARHRRSERPDGLALRALEGDPLLLPLDLDAVVAVEVREEQPAEAVVPPGDVAVGLVEEVAGGDAGIVLDLGVEPPRALDDVVDALAAAGGVVPVAGVGLVDELDPLERVAAGDRAPLRADDALRREAVARPHGEAGAARAGERRDPRVVDAPAPEQGLRLRVGRLPERRDARHVRDAALLGPAQVARDGLDSGRRARQNAGEPLCEGRHSRAYPIR
jgi:hypothetical protein